MIDRETIKPTEERLKNVLAKHQDILGVFYNANIFSLFIDDGNGNVYGYLSDKYNESITLSGGMTEIKMSEYYAAIEALEAANK